VYLLIRRLAPRASVFAVLAGALFFGLHPLRVESVAWASERRDVLSASFYLATLLAYLRMQEGPRLPWLAVALVCYALSLLSKASGITLPAVLLVLDVYPLRRRTRARVLVEKLPFVLLAAGAAAMALRGVEPVEATRTLAQHGVLARAAQAAYGLCFYLWRTAEPRRLSPLYLLDLRLDPAEPRYVLCMLAVAALTAALVIARRRWPWALAAWACYVITASPVLGVVQTGPQVAADRYTYLACLPWAVLVAAGVGRLDAPVVRLAVLAGLGALGVLTWRQVGVWRTSRTLWEHVLRVDPDNYVAYTNRGSTRDLEGDHDGALADYSAAIRIHPGYSLAYYNRGNERQARGDVQGAIADLGAAIQLNPRDPRYWNNRGWARQAAGDLDGAAADYAQALRVAPPDFAGRVRIERNLAAVRARGGRF
jgi:tetratricopeptide (TPR) repeat protein